MAAAASQRPMPLLRRPLPPKPVQKPQLSSSSSSTRFNEDNTSTGRSRSPVISARSRSRPKASAEGGKTYHGDIALPKAGVVQPYRPRGPPPLPPRQPRKVREVPADVLDSYKRPPPAFTLKNFVLRIPSRCGQEENSEIMISDHNYEKLTSWFIANRPTQSQIHSLDIDATVQVPDVTPRIPTQQLLIEMRVPVAEMESVESPDLFLYADHRIAKMPPVTPAVSKQTLPSRQRPFLPPINQNNQGGLPGTKSEGPEKDHVITTSKDHSEVQKEPVVKTTGQSTEAEEIDTDTERIHEQSQAVDDNNLGKQKINFKEDIEESFECNEMKDEQQRKEPELMWMKEKGLTFHQLPEVITYAELDVLLPSSAPAYFQGEAIARTSSPFVSTDQYQTQVTPLEAVIMNALVTESATLNLKALFLSQLPTLVQLADHLTHLNASFNDFWVFPPEILDLKLLVSLKLRNNPIKEIPHGISDLKNLRVLDISFNLLSSLPKCLFELTELEILDLSYNRISFLPTEIGNLSNLRELSLEGNQIRALPVTALCLRLKYLRIGNNYIHPLFWKETASNQPQRLVDLCALTVSNTEQDSLRMATLPDSLKSFLKSPGQCDCCGGVKLGQGIRVIKAADVIFGVKNLPFLFLSCSQRCRKKFMKNKDAIQLWLLRHNITVNKPQQ